MNLFDLMCLVILVVVTARTLACLIQPRTHSAGVDDPVWAWTVAITPPVMLFQPTRLSCVPMLEAEMAKRKPGFTGHVRTLSPWILRLPRQRS